MSEGQQTIQLPARTRAALEQAIRERDTLQSLLQQQQQQIASIIEVARECLDVPTEWRIVDLAVGFAPPEKAHQQDIPKN